MRFLGWLIFVVLIAGCRTPPPSKPIRLTVLGLSLEAESQLRQDAIADFTRKTGIEVDMIPTPGNSAEQTALMLKLLGRHSSSPDIYMVDVVWPGTLQAHLLDLTP